MRSSAALDDDPEQLPAAVLHVERPAGHALPVLRGKRVDHGYEFARHPGHRGAADGLDVADDDGVLLRRIFEPVAGELREPLADVPGERPAPDFTFALQFALHTHCLQMGGRESRGRTGCPGPKRHARVATARILESRAGRAQKTGCPRSELFGFPGPGGGIPCLEYRAPLPGGPRRGLVSPRGFVLGWRQSEDR